MFALLSKKKKQTLSNIVGVDVEWVIEVLQIISCQWGSWVFELYLLEFYVWKFCKQFCYQIIANLNKKITLSICLSDYKC